MKCYTYVYDYFTKLLNCWRWRYCIDYLLGFMG